MSKFVLRNGMFGIVLALIPAFMFVYSMGVRDGVRAPLEDSRVIERFNQIYYERGLWEQAKWLGVQSWQTPTDNWVMQEIITELKPDLIIEVGTSEGGTALFYAEVLSHVHPEGKIVTIDIENTVVRKVKENPLFNKYVEFIQSDSVSPELIQRLKVKAEGKTVLVTLDSDHSKAHVSKELPLYAELVSVGSYYLIQDTNLNGHPVYPHFGPGPWEALQDFLKTETRFEVDHSREKFLLTFHPSGYLKRVR